MTTPRKRVLSGMQPSGLLHLGNYLGALENWKGLQNEFECYFFVADWHALSTNYADTGRVREFVHELLIDWLAAGIDPAKATVFVQSRIPEHAVLHLLFSMIIPVAWLERNPTYKEKREEMKEKRKEKRQEMKEKRKEKIEEMKEKRKEKREEFKEKKEEAKEKKAS